MTTQTTEPVAAPPVGATRPAPRAGKARWTVILLMILSLGASMALQQFADRYRTAAITRNLPQDLPRESSVGSLDSFSLVLLLGGLRGPLVMYLWSSSENQKTEKDLESFDSKVEMIRLLQPEFDTVIMYQMWNKAYNISVQMASLSNKYATILDALDFGRKADQANPNSINIIGEIGRLYSSKLGDSSEKEYYRSQVRTQTLPVYLVHFPADARPAIQKALADANISQAKTRFTQSDAGMQIVLDKFSADRFKASLGKLPAGVTIQTATRQSLRPRTAGRRTELDTMLTADGMILPELLKAYRTVPPGQEGNDGSELQYLAQFQPFPYGLSPAALGYNYLKKAQVLQSVGKQRHAMWSEMVTDNLPGLTLKQWAEEEVARGRTLEQRGLKSLPDADKLAGELRTAGVRPDQPVTDPFLIDEAIYSYGRAEQVAGAALKEYDRHLKNYSQTVQNYQSHTDTIHSTAELAAADGLYLRAIRASTDARRKELLAKAKERYTEAERWYHLMVFRYYVTPTDGRAIGLVRDSLDKKSLPELRQLLEKLNQHLKATYKPEAAIPNIMDLSEYQEHIARIAQRLARIG